MESITYFYPDRHEGHYLYAHPERPERVEAIKMGLEDIGQWEQYTHSPPLEFPPELLETVHAREYLQLLERACQRAQMLDPDTYTTNHSWQLALNAGGGGLAVAEKVWDREAKTGFALTRPPGHHATIDRGMGFCLINNVAVAAEYLLREKSARKVSIIDLDLHHGNGTQDIFWESGQVSYISTHQAPFYPGTGALYETGAGNGKGTTLNLPIPQMAGDVAYRTLVNEVILPYLSTLEPEMLLISYGFDTHWRDPLGSMQTSAACIYEIMIDLIAWSEEHCQGKIAVFLEGGYDLEAGRACGAAVGAALTGKKWDDPLGSSPNMERDDWRDTLIEAKKILNLK